MITHGQLFPDENRVPAHSAAPVFRWLRSLGPRLAAWANDCADHWAAAVFYEQLSALSDAELARRSLSRATLAHDVHNACVPGASGEHPSS